MSTSDRACTELLILPKTRKLIKNTNVHMEAAFVKW